MVETSSLSSLSTGAIIGIIFAIFFGIAIFVAFLLGCVLWRLRCMGKRVHAQELAEKEEDERLKRMEEAQEKRKSSQTQPSQTQSVYSWMPQLPASAHAPSQAPPSHLAPPRPYQPQPQPHQLPPQARRYSQEPIHGRPRTQYYQPQQQQQQKQYQPSIHESQANRQLQTPAARPVSQSFVLVPATSQAS